MTVLDAIILLQQLPQNHELYFDIAGSMSEKFEGLPVDHINIATDDNGKEIVLIQTDHLILPFSAN